MRVMKFGVVSVSDAVRLREMAQIVRDAHDDGEPLIVVCAAIGGITDKLINAARSAANGADAVVEDVRRELWSRHRTLAEARDAIREHLEAQRRSACQKSWINGLRRSAQAA